MLQGIAWVLLCVSLAREVGINLVGCGEVEH